ncbi:MAG: ferric reductase-like transmembrane domain-containing protein [Balneolaceae bacterium]
MNSKYAFYKSIIFWLGLFVIVVTAPLFISGLDHDEASRGFWTEFGSGLGFVALAIMILQFLLTARFRNIKPGFGHDGLLYFHRQAGLIAWLFVIGHFTVLFLADSEFTSYLDPAVNAPRAIALVFVVILLTLLLAASYWRKTFGLNYEWWRLTHGLAALTVVLIGLGHALMVDFYTSGLWKKGMWILFTGVAVALLLHVRIGKPYKISGFPYKVTGVKEETEDVWTLEVEADNHHGMNFEAGQFAWLTLGDTPFKLQQHPFSFSSSAENQLKCQFTIKELGDFTGKISTVETGTEVYLEGPYGTYTLPSDMDAYIIFFAGGIGITPIMSMLRTMNDRNDPREIILFYGNKDEETTAFRSELEAIQKTLNLKIIHVLEEPPEAWEGETGFINEEIMKRHLPEDSDKVIYYVNGPPVMQEAIESTLQEGNVPLWRMNSESFEIV